MDMDITLDAAFDPAPAREGNRAHLARCARDLAAEIDRLETDEDKLSVLMGLGVLTAEVAALAALQQPARGPG